MRGGAPLRGAPALLLPALLLPYHLRRELRRLPAHAPHRRCPNPAPALHPQGGPLALQLAKQAISLGAELDLASGLRVEEACYAQVGAGAGPVRLARPAAGACC